MRPLGQKLLWTGLTLIETAVAFHVVPDAAVVGAVLMVIGCILMWLDK